MKFKIIYEQEDGTRAERICNFTDTETAGEDAAFEHDAGYHYQLARHRASMQEDRLNDLCSLGYTLADKGYYSVHQWKEDKYWEMVADCYSRSKKQKKQRYYHGVAFNKMV